MGLFIGLDVGTQGAKAVVYDADKRAVVSRGASKYDVLKSDVPGRAEQHPSTWLEGGFSAIQQALGSEGLDRHRVKGIGVSGQQHGFVPLSEKGEVIRNAKLWCDVEAAPEAEAMSERWGFTIPPGFTAPKIAWLKEHEPEAFSRLRHVLLPHDFLNFTLTGRYVTECGDASGTGVLDISQRRWDTDRQASIDPELPGYFPDLVGPDEAVGELTREAAEQLGLPAPQGVLVAPGSGDNQMAALGAGAVAEGTLVASLGTSGTLFGVSGRPVLDPSGGIAPFCDATGKWLPLLCTMNCTLPAEEVRKAFGMDHAALTEAAQQEAPGSDGVNFLPFLTGERTPNWPHSSGALIGLRPGRLRPGSVYRAALEGATFSLLNGLRLLEGQGVRPKEVRVVGGAARNPLWRTILADAFQLPLRFPTEQEAGALGGALQAAAVAEGVPVGEFIAANEPPLEEQVVHPDERRKEAYEEAFARHTQLSQTLFGKGH